MLAPHRTTAVGGPGSTDASVSGLAGVEAGAADLEEAKEMEQSAAGRITVDEFAEASFNAVLRALDARAERVRDERPPFGPIIYGIIAWPSDFPGSHVPLGGEEMEQ